MCYKTHEHRACCSSVLLKCYNCSSLMANAWLRRNDVLRTLNTSHDYCYCRAVNSSTSYHFMVAWYIRVKTESVVRDTFCAIRVIFTLSGKWRARWYFLCHLSISSSIRAEKMTAEIHYFRLPCLVTMCMKSRLIDRPPEWPLVKLSRVLYQCELSILVACTQLIQCACRIAGPPSRTTGLCCRSHQKIYDESMVEKKGRTVVSVRAVKA
jgi:hypothetical protein